MRTAEEAKKLVEENRLRKDRIALEKGRLERAIEKTVKEGKSQVYIYGWGETYPEGFDVRNEMIEYARSHGYEVYEELIHRTLNGAVLHKVMWND